MVTQARPIFDGGRLSIADSTIPYERDWKPPIQRVHFSRPSPRCPREVLKIDCALLHACVEETLRERDAAVGEVKCTG